MIKGVMTVRAECGTGQVWVPQPHAAASGTSLAGSAKEGHQRKRFEEKGLRFQAQECASKGTEARKRPENELEEGKQ